MIKRSKGIPTQAPGSFIVAHEAPTRRESHLEVDLSCTTEARTRSRCTGHPDQQLQFQRAKAVGQLPILRSNMLVTKISKLQVAVNACKW